MPTITPYSGTVTPLARVFRPLAIGIAGVTLMTISAKVQIPFWPVPMTLHTMAVMAFALLLGPRMAVAIFTAYLAAGIAGLPVFAGSPARGLGLTYIAGPTGGYLVGYLLASGVTGWLAVGRGWLGQTFAMLTGLGVVYGFGLIWLSVFVSSAQLVAVGVLPFLAGDLAKIALVGLAAQGMARLRGLK